MREHCETCAAETDHDVRIERREEGGAEETAQFSREPYRISTCTDCGFESELRMNTQ